MAPFFAVPRRSAAAHDWEIGCATCLTLPPLARYPIHPLLRSSIGVAGGPVGPLSLPLSDSLRVGFLTLDGLFEGFLSGAFTLLHFSICGAHRRMLSLLQQWGNGKFQQDFSVVWQWNKKVDPALISR